MDYQDEYGLKLLDDIKGDVINDIMLVQWAFYEDRGEELNYVAPGMNLINCASIYIIFQSETILKIASLEWSGAEDSLFTRLSSQDDLKECFASSGEGFRKISISSFNSLLVEDVMIKEDAEREALITICLVFSNNERMYLFTGDCTEQADGSLCVLQYGEDILLFMSEDDYLQLNFEFNPQPVSEHREVKNS